MRFVVPLSLACLLVLTFCAPARAQIGIDPPAPGDIWPSRDPAAPQLCGFVTPFVPFAVYVVGHPTTSADAFDVSIEVGSFTVLASVGLGGVLNVAPQASPTDWIGMLASCVAPGPHALLRLDLMAFSAVDRATVCLLSYRFVDPSTTAPRWYECNGGVSHDFGLWPPDYGAVPGVDTTGCLVVNARDPYECPVGVVTTDWSTLKSGFR